MYVTRYARTGDIGWPHLYGAWSPSRFDTEDQVKMAARRAFSGERGISWRVVRIQEVAP